MYFMPSILLPYQIYVNRITVIAKDANLRPMDYENNTSKKNYIIQYPLV